MSVVVRMEMPKNCCECQLRQEDYEMREEFCPFTGVECLSIGRQNPGQDGYTGHRKMPVAHSGVPDKEG